MKVIATEVGFYGKLMKVDEGFTIKDKSHLGKWMEEFKVEVEVRPKAKAKTKIKA